MPSKVKNVFIFSFKASLWGINFCYNARVTKSSLFEAYRNPFQGRFFKGMKNFHISCLSYAAF